MAGDDNNEKVILKSADVTLCQNTQCNDDDSFVSQFIGLNFKMPMSKIIDVGPQDMLPEPEEPEEEDKPRSKSSFKVWILGPILACLIIVAACIYLFIDYKKKIFIFKKKDNDFVEKPETKANIEIKDIDKISVKDSGKISVKDTDTIRDKITEKKGVRKKRIIKNIPSYFSIGNKLSINN